MKWPPRAGHQPASAVLSEIAGRVVELHFVMEQAKLYTFTFQ